MPTKEECKNALFGFIRRCVLTASSLFAVFGVVRRPVRHYVLNVVRLTKAER